MAYYVKGIVETKRKGQLNFKKVHRQQRTSMDIYLTVPFSSKIIGIYYTSHNSVLLYSIYQPRALFCHILCYSYNARSTGRYLHQKRTG